MQITVKIKYGSSNTRIEGFGNSRYLVFLMSKQGEIDADIELRWIISKKLGVPPGRISIVQDKGSDKVVQLD